jgi:plastocyanin
VGSAEQRIDLVIENRTPVPHNFSTVDGRIDRDVATDKSITVTVTFPKEGYLFFFCKYHLQDRQVGALETSSS